MIQLIRMFTSEEVVEAVARVVRSGRYISGPENRAFEEEFADFCSTDHAVAVSSGTAALHLTFRALGLKPGDEVIVPSHTFIATAEPIVDIGATPVFVDIDPTTFTIDPSAIDDAVTDRTVGLVPVHLYGHPADMDPIMNIANTNDLWVLEDACQAHGAEYKGRRAGSMGNAGVFSFYPSKNMTVAGDGGMMVTSDDELAAKVSQLRDHGRIPGEKYLHSMIGFNYRMSEMHAAVGRVQLSHLDEWIGNRRHVAGRFDAGLAGPVLPSAADWAKHVYHLYVIRAPDRDGLGDHLRENGVANLIHYPVPVHKQPAFDVPVSLPITEEVAGEILSIPMHPFLEEDEIDTIIGGVNGFFR
jgi:dTDP-4-amino-4,6-dideoxygalactose transaminase